MNGETTDQNGGSNRRRHTRYQFSNPLIVTLLSGRSFKGVTVNVSEGGAAVSVSRETLTVGEKIFIEMIGSLRYALGFLVAEVVYQTIDGRLGGDHSLVGLKFTQMTQLQKEALKKILY